MRNIKHHCIVLTSHDQKNIQEVRVKLMELVKSNIEASNGSKMVGDITESLINNFYSIVLYPDGSKEGHETSDDGDILRKKVIEYLTDYNLKNPDNQINFVEFYYGSDDGKASILNQG